MQDIDRHALTSGIVFGGAVAAVGLTVSSEAAVTMPLGNRVPGSLGEWLEKTHVWVAPPPASPRLAFLVA